MMTRSATPPPLPPLSPEELSGMKEFEEFQAKELATVNERVKKRPILETLSNPSSIMRALIVLPMPWVCLYTVYQLLRAKNEPLQLLPLSVAFLIGYFLIDLTTGVIHMVFDTLPIPMSRHKTAAQKIAWGFQRHHALQHNWLHDDILESGILTSGLLVVPFYVVYLVLYNNDMIINPYTAIGWTTFIAAGMHVQIFHAASHNTWRKSHPQLHGVLQQLMAFHLILDTKSHHLHHTKFDCNFALINGWSNPLLNLLYQYLEAHNLIHPEMQGEAQRQVFIQEKALLSATHYCRMMPQYRHYQQRLLQHKPTSNATAIQE